VRGCNALLPAHCSVQWASVVSDDFHARFSASHRQYHYWIYCAPNRHPLIKTAAWVFQPLNIAHMSAAMPALLGEHDFSAFRAAQCQANTPIRTLQIFELQAYGPYLKVTLQANAFLHHMARNLIGSLLEIGLGNQPVEWLFHILEGRDRRKAAKTAPACGLALVQVGYDNAFGLPVTGPGAFSPVPLLHSLSREV
jgi:tRNA pseudouridine38-40 synthase